MWFMLALPFYLRYHDLSFSGIRGLYTISMYKIMVTYSLSCVSSPVFLNIEDNYILPSVINNPAMSILSPFLFFTEVICPVGVELLVAEYMTFNRLLRLNCLWEVGSLHTLQVMTESKWMCALPIYPHLLWRCILSFLLSFYSLVCCLLDTSTNSDRDYDRKYIVAFIIWDLAGCCLFQFFVRMTLDYRLLDAVHSLLCTIVSTQNMFKGVRR